MKCLVMVCSIISDGCLFLVLKCCNWFMVMFSCLVICCWVRVFCWCRCRRFCVKFMENFLS